MRLLILNWRDPSHPRAGGAETFTFEVARRLVAQGDSVDWFSAAFPGAPAEEDLDGIRILRKGSQRTVHWHAFHRYRGRLLGRFDAVIDEVNTIPFFTPLWAGIPTFMLIFQLAREVWWYESRFPVSALGFLAEPLYLRCYRRTPAFTISQSTELDLRSLGFRGPITIVPIGTDPVDDRLPPKAAMPTFLYVGRLSPSKRVSDIVQAFGCFRETAGPAQLWLLGDGPTAYVRDLRCLVNELGLANDVRFCGRVSQQDKLRRMAEAHVLLMASAREGWGLVVAEANACATPAVVYDVPGLRDAVRHDKTGLVVAASPERLAQGMLQLWKNPLLYKKLANQAVEWSRTFTFDKSATAIKEGIRQLLAQTSAGD